MFGDNVLVATVCQPVDTLTGTARRDVWFPAGNDWYDMAHKQMIKGGSKKTLEYTIAENCWFVKAGAILPLAHEGIQSLQDKTNALRIYVAPGKGKSTYRHYEDDGVSQAYETDYAVTEIVKNATSSTCTVTVSAREGNYKGIDPQRDLTVVLGGLDRKPVSAKMGATVLDVTYDPAAKEASVKLPVLPADENVSVVIKY